MTPTPQPALPKNSGERQKKDPTEVTQGLTPTVLSGMTVPPGSSTRLKIREGVFTANAAWLICAAISHNLTRAVGALASAFHARARIGTIRAHLIHAPGRIARSAHRLALHLPRHWPWQPSLDELFRQALHDPLPTAA
jgi:hypothetical protein